MIKIGPGFKTNTCEKKNNICPTKYLVHLCQLQQISCAKTSLEKNSKEKFIKIHFEIHFNITFKM